MVSPYEILLMLDPDLPEERQTEIVTRMRELIERQGGTWDTHDVWGRRKLSYEIDHKTDGAYHLVTFSADAGDARRDLARPQDHRRGHAPSGRAPKRAPSPTAGSVGA